MTISDHPKQWVPEDAMCIRAFADCDMNATRAAKQCGFSRQGMIYHLLKIKNMTGLNPRCFHDLNKLLDEINKA